MSIPRWKVWNTLGTLLIVTGLLLCGWPVAVGVYGHWSQSRLEQDFKREEARIITEAPRYAAIKLPAAFAPLAPVPSIAAVTRSVPPPRRKLKPGQPFCRLRIPRIGVNAVVVEGVTDACLRRGPGHIPETGRPGEARNCAIAAHRAHWFRDLPQVKKGDTIWIDMPEMVYRYTVVSQRTVTPERGDALNVGRKPMLTLITCDKPTADAPYRILIFAQGTATYPRK